ncbi:gamma-aminobutyric acid receptor subunit gamma-1-like isoform X2 [Montipora capricornis]|uniref:gamma-aminobutyric acid receptor subunit gamma-1-like isoform X2 n=1 Tax=Montipora capricornis TaxID=246305 RepID=UPI0035F1C6FE
MAKYWMGIFTLFTLFTPNIAQCETGLPARQSNRATNSSMKLAEYLSTEYDNAVRPNCGSGKPTEVFIDIYVVSFGNIMEMNMELPLHMYFRQMWVDDRIAKSVKSNALLRRELVNLLWFPDSFCYNARKSDLMLPDTNVDSVVRIDPNGFVFYSRSAHILASCELDLHDFPMDTQLCEITFGSYGHTESDILMKWKNPTIEIGNREMAQFSVGDAVLSTKVNSYTSGNYTALTVTFPFKRRMGYYVIQVYIPCIFLVMLSWIVFWMRPDDSASRLTVGITTILTIVFLLGYTNGMLPKDISSEFSLNNIDLTIRRSSETVQITSESSDFHMEENVKRKGTVHVLPLTKKNMTGNEKSEVDPRSPDKNISTGKPGEKTTLRLTSGSGRSWAIKLDLACRILFPLAYALYNTLYWYMYLNGIDAQA